MILTWPVIKRRLYSRFRKPNVSRNVFDSVEEYFSWLGNCFDYAAIVLTPKSMPIFTSNFLIRSITCRSFFASFWCQSLRIAFVNHAMEWLTMIFPFGLDEYRFNGVRRIPFWGDISQIDRSFGNPLMNPRTTSSSSIVICEVNSSTILKTGLSGGGW